ncbi:unnamed protein product, partial [Mesorhabditis belari]|uniref:Uncharacterized protein n=1 Tax=Mesorhabditis belari TaxID=2138241 RepID=A0AAF3FE18_9BILA
MLVHRRRGWNSKCHSIPVPHPAALRIPGIAQPLPQKWFVDTATYGHSKQNVLYTIYPNLAVTREVISMEKNFDFSYAGEFVLLPALHSDSIFINHLAEQAPISCDQHAAHRAHTPPIRDNEGMDPPLQSLPGNESESNQCDFVTNQMANLQGSNGNFMESLRVRQNSRRSQSCSEGAVEASAQMLDDLRQPITGINGHSQRPAAMIVAPPFEDAFPRTPMQATTTSRTPMQATSRIPMRVTPRPIFQTCHIDETRPQNVPVRKVRPLSILPSLMQMPVRGPRIPTIAFSPVFRQPHPPITDPFQNQNGAPKFNGPVEVCSYCRSSGQRYYYGHTKKNCPKYCPANKMMLNLKRSEEEHRQFMRDIKKGREID